MNEEILAGVTEGREVTCEEVGMKTWDARGSWPGWIKLSGTDPGRSLPAYLRTVQFGKVFWYNILRCVRRHNYIGTKRGVCHFFQEDGF